MPKISQKLIHSLWVRCRAVMGSKKEEELTGLPPAACTHPHPGMLAAPPWVYSIYGPLANPLPHYPQWWFECRQLDWSKCSQMPSMSSIRNTGTPILWLGQDAIKATCCLLSPPWSKDSAAFPLSGKLWYSAYPLTAPHHCSSNPKEGIDSHSPSKCDCDVCQGRGVA